MRSAEPTEGLTAFVCTVAIEPPRSDHRRPGATTPLRDCWFGCRKDIAGRRLQRRCAGIGTGSAPANPSEFVEYQPKVLWTTDPRPAEICADLRFNAQPQDAVEAGILFWSTVDRRNVYDACLWVVSSSGWAELKRINGDQWAVILSEQDSNVKTGPGASNSLCVSVNYDAVSFFVNGSIVRKLRDIFQPPGATKFGVGGFLLEPLRASTTIDVTNFKVTAPSAP